MRDGIGYLIGVLGFLLGMFIFWYAGIDFNNRGPWQAFYLSLAIFFGASLSIIYLASKAKGEL